MPQNRGKKFENVIRDAFLKTAGVSIDRIHDQTNGYKNSSNICDFIVYKWPYQYYIECKAIHGNTFSIHSNNPANRYGLVTNNQWEGLLKKSYIPGVKAGLLIWYIDHDLTFFVPIQFAQAERDCGKKSLKVYNLDKQICKVIMGNKKRVFFDYDMESFFNF